MSTLERAISVAVEAHAGHVDKAGRPYVLHPLRVMANCNSEAAKIVGVLHDVVEDTHWTLAKLRAEGFDEEVLTAMDAVTRMDGEPYFKYCRRAADDALAREVKRADLIDNMDVSRLAPPLTDKDWGRLCRYYEALRIINGVAAGSGDT